MPLEPLPDPLPWDGVYNFQVNIEGEPSVVSIQLGGSFSFTAGGQQPDMEAIEGVLQNLLDYLAEFPGVTQVSAGKIFRFEQPMTVTPPEPE